MYFKLKAFYIRFFPLLVVFAILGLVAFFKGVFAIQELDRDSIVFDIAFWSVQIIVWSTILFFGFLLFKGIRFLIKKVLLLIQ